MSHPLLIDRWFARLPWSRTWSIAAISALLIVTPIVAAWIDGFTAWTLFVDNRAQFLYVALIAYFLLMLPHVMATREQVAWGLQPTLELTDAALQEVVTDASRIKPQHEVSAFCIGVAIGWLINVEFEPLGDAPGLFDRYAYLSRLLIFGVDIWALFILFSMPRVTNALLRHVAHVDVFDVTPFDPVGRQSLLLTFTIVGAAILGLLSISLQNRFLWQQYLIVYGVLLVAIVAIFVINTYPAHRALVTAKRQQLAFVDRNLSRAYFALKQDVERSNVPPATEYATAAEIQALAAIRQQILAARTWPFDTEMVRYFFLAVFAPLFVGIARMIVERMAQ